MYGLASFAESVFSIISTIKIFDLMDIVIVAFILYKILDFIKDTRVEQLMKGVVFFLIATQLSSTFKLYTLHWILVNSLQLGFVAIFIIFQDELRTGLERLGRANIKLKRAGDRDISQESSYKALEIITDSLFELSKDKTGALIVIEKQTRLTEIMRTGTPVDALISQQLLVNIFTPNTPLHDGAVVIKDFKISACGCFLPLTKRDDLSKDLGTRHRAGIGISEVTDALTLIVSEETGKVSIVQEGILSRDLNHEEVYNVLVDNLIIETKQKSFFSRRFLRKDSFSDEK